MQERLTDRVGRFVLVLAGRPPAVPGNGRGPRDLKTGVARADPVGRAAEAGSTAFPSSRTARPAAFPSTRTARPVRRARLTASGALLGMLALCLVTCLLAAWWQVDVVAGLGFCAGCVLAPVYARRAAQLRVAVSAPVIFLLAEIVAQSITAPGNSGHGAAVSVLEGTVLALADVAPWLFAGTALCITIALFRGLPQCVRDLRTGANMGSAGRGAQPPGPARAGTALRDQHSHRS